MFTLLRIWSPLSFGVYGFREWWLIFRVHVGCWQLFVLLVLGAWWGAPSERGMCLRRGRSLAQRQSVFSAGPERTEIDPRLQAARAWRAPASWVPCKDDFLFLQAGSRYHNHCYCFNIQRAKIIDDKDNLSSKIRLGAFGTTNNLLAAGWKYNCIYIKKNN